MALKEIKSRYAGKCTRCGREIKEGWDIAFDGETTPKTVLCMPCYRNSDNSPGMVCAECETPISENATFCSNCGAQVWKPPTASEMHEEVISELSLIKGAVNTLFDNIERSNADIVGKFDNIFNTLNKKQPKEKE